MDIILICTVEDVNAYEGKNGYGCNITVSQLQNKHRKQLSFITKSPLIAKTLEEKLQEEVTIKIALEQNNFGLRLSEVKEVA